MKKILVFAYLRNNLGDDIFVNELVKRYPNNKFFINVLKEEYGKPFKKYDNAVIQTVEIENFEEIEINQYDGFVYIGGSIFMEGGKVYNLDEGCYQFIKKCKELDKPFFYISSNYGPYKTEEYFELSKRTFETCKDLCFRDKYSYKLFQEIASVRYAPDAAFTYNAGELKKKKDTVGINLIDLNIRDSLREKEEEYIEFINNNITTYLGEGKKVYLFSFCKHEGDEDIIKKIYNMRKSDFDNKKIQVIKYKGDIEEFINQYKQMEYMICERFHSLILSYVFKQKFFVISYSKKIDNIIEELQLCKEYISFEKIKKEKIIDLKDFNCVDVKKLDNLKKDAEKQFEKLDLFMKG